MRIERILLRGAAALCTALAGAAAAQQAPARPLNVLADPDFELATRSFSAGESLELAAHIHMAVRQYEQAIPMYEALLKSAPNRAEVWAMLAAAYNRVDDPREALDAAGIAITLAPHYPHFYAERGIAAFRLGMHERGIEDLKHFVKAFPVNARGHYYLGLAQAAHGDADAARANLLKARALNPALTLLTDYYLGLMAAQRGQIGTGRNLLAPVQSAFAGTNLPVAGLISQQLKEVDGAVSRRMRAAMHESDARLAPVPGAQAMR